MGRHIRSPKPKITVEDLYAEDEARLLEQTRRVKKSVEENEHDKWCKKVEPKLVKLFTKHEVEPGDIKKIGKMRKAVQILSFASNDQQLLKKMDRNFIKGRQKHNQQMLDTLQAIRGEHYLMDRLKISTDKLYKEIERAYQRIEAWKKQYTTIGGTVRGCVRELFGDLIHEGYKQGQCINLAYDILCFAGWENYGIKDLEHSHKERLRQIHQAVLKERKKFLKWEEEYEKEKSMT
jgi:hypothetical protein